MSSEATCLGCGCQIVRGTGYRYSRCVPCANNKAKQWRVENEVRYPDKRTRICPLIPNVRLSGRRPTWDTPSITPVNAPNLATSSSRCLHCLREIPSTSRSINYCCNRCSQRGSNAGRLPVRGCVVCGDTLPPNHAKYCNNHTGYTSGSRAKVCPLIPDKRLRPFANQPEWLRVTWPRPSRIPYGVKVVRRTCVVCDRRFRGKTGETRCTQCPRPVLGDMHGPFVEDIGPIHDYPSLDEVACCEFCNLHFAVGTGRGRKFCSNSCESYGRGRASLSTDISFGVCRLCGKTYCREARHDNGFCSSSCNTRHTRKQRKAERRAHHQAGESFTLREIAERDGWRCHLCGGKVPDRKYAARDNDPTLDHLVPVSAGGEHTRVNVALAHNRCNWERSNEGAAQLRLVG